MPARSQWQLFARQSLARLRRAGAAECDGGFQLSSRLNSRERRLLHRWIVALPPGLRRQLPGLLLAPAEEIVRIGRRVLFDAPSEVGRRGDRSTQAVSYVAERVVVMRRRLFRQPGLGQRLFYHELCHFLWPRLSPSTRAQFNRWLRAERRSRVRGELGYTAAYRKERVAEPRRRGTQNRWREYVCESFCDTGAYALLHLAGRRAQLRSVEFTLAARPRRARLERWTTLVLPALSTASLE